MPLSPEDPDRIVQRAAAEFTNGRQALLIVVAIALSLGSLGCNSGSTAPWETTDSTSPEATDPRS